MSKVMNYVLGATALAGVNFVASEAAADCVIKTDNGKNRVVHLQAAGAAKACGIHTAMLGFKHAADASAKMHCSGSSCTVREAQIEYDFSKNVVTVFADGHKSSFNAGNYTGSVRQSQRAASAQPPAAAPSRAPRVEDSRECNIFKGLVFQGRAPACSR